MKMDKMTFRLGGKEYRLSKNDVEERMRSVSAKPLGKYRVSIGGKDYPPKQIIAESLGKDLISFTTMDAQRILSALGFEVLRVGEKRQSQRTESEFLFEQYLDMSGLSEFQFKKEFPDKTQQLDFLVELSDRTKIFFEVKEFRATPEDFRGSAGAYDPYEYVREKIKEANSEFKALSNACCCLVLFNRDKPLVDLSWQFVYGAMLGNIAFQIPFNPETGIGLANMGANRRFADGGEMRPNQPGTISAILTLEILPVGRIRLNNYFRQENKKRKLEGKPELEPMEQHEIRSECRGTERDDSLRQLRGIVHENPYAPLSTKLPDDLFRGPYDERYGGKDGRIERLFAGPGIIALEKEGWEQSFF